MKLTILGGGAGWPTARQACGGYLVDHDGFTLLIDPGYGTLPALLATREPGDVDAVLITHGHLDHCADLNPLLRARVLGSVRHEALPVYAPAGALDLVLAADRLRAVARGAAVETVTDGTTLDLGPFHIDVALLRHHTRNAGFRIAAGGRVLAYAGDSGPCAERVTLAREADVLLAEATWAEQVPPDEAAYLSDARQAADLAGSAGARTTVLTHLWPGESAERCVSVARAAGLGGAVAATPGLLLDLDAPAVSTLPDVVAEPRVEEDRSSAAAVTSIRRRAVFAAARARRASEATSRSGDIPVLPRRASPS